MARRLKSANQVDHTKVSPGSYTSRIAHRLSDFRRLRRSSDFCACNDLFSTCARLRHHAFVRVSSGRGISREVRCSMQRESLSSRFDMCGPSCQVVKRSKAEDSVDETKVGWRRRESSRALPCHTASAWPYCATRMTDIVPPSGSRQCCGAGI